MNILLKSNKPSSCIVLFEAECAESSKADLTENLRLYTTSISVASKLQNYEKAIDLVFRMKKEGVVHNIKKLTAIISACSSTQRIDYALNVYDQINRLAEVRKGEYEMDGWVLTLAVRAYYDGGHFEKAGRIITSQNDSHKDISGKEIMTDYNYLLESSLKNRKYDVARDALVSNKQSFLCSLFFSIQFTDTFCLSFIFVKI